VGCWTGAGGTPACHADVLGVSCSDTGPPRSIRTHWSGAPGSAPRWEMFLSLPRVLLLVAAGAGADPSLPGSYQPALETHLK